MQILNDKIKLSELNSTAQKMFGSLVKGTVDVKKEIVAIDAELHSDLAEFLVENGSHGQNLWGFNIYPELGGDEWLEFDSMINVKPNINNRTRNIENPQTKKIAEEIIKKFIVP